MALAFTIAGVSQAIQQGWRISETLNGRNVMTFDVVSLDGTYRPASRAAVRFTNGATTLFAGTISDRDESGLGGVGGTPIVTKCGAVDYNVLPDWRQVALTIPAGATLKQALEQIVPYLSGYGVALAAGQVAGPTLAEALVFDVGPLTEVLNKLAVITGYTWAIDYDKQLSMQAPGATAAPFDITASDGSIIGDLTVAPSLGDYANSVTVRFTAAAQAAYAYLACTGNFVEGDTVTVGKTYTFQDDLPLVNTDGVIWIGATLAASLQRLAWAITLDAAASPGTDYAGATTANGSVTAWVQSDTQLGVRALAAGVAGNAITVASTASTATWTTDGGGATSTLLFGVDESLATGVTVTSDPPPDPEDLVERVFDHPDIRDVATARAMATGYLVRSLREAREVRYRTLTAGLHPGQQQTITEPARDLTSAFLITQVDTSANGNVLQYEVTATEGLVVGEDIRDTYRGWSGRSTSSATAVSGGISSAAVPVAVALGGVDTAAIPMAGSPAYTDVWNVLSYYPPADVTGTVRVWLWARDAGVGVTARLRNVTDGTTAGTSSTVTATSRPSSPQAFAVALTAGKEYRLQVIGDTASKAVYAIGTMEVL